jgi:hypothetical protein
LRTRAATAPGSSCACTSSTYHTSDPEATTKRRELRPPRDYGKIDLRSFDPDSLLKREW